MRLFLCNTTNFVIGFFRKLWGGNPARFIKEVE